MLYSVTLGMLVVAVVLQLFYYLFFFQRFFSPPSKTRSAVPKPKVSVVICARNAAHHLNKNLTSILTQNYLSELGTPHFEVIVVNDGSSDDTLLSLSRLQQIFNHLVVVSLEDGNRSLPGKKWALKKGIEAASHDHLLFTDADCIPNSNLWIETMMNGMTAQVKMIGGYAPMFKTGTWVNVLARWETLHTFLQYFSFWKSGFPYMAVGRNLAYHKNLEQRISSSKAYKSLVSGDDDLLVQTLKNKNELKILQSEQTWMFSHAPDTFFDWVMQKQRHVSTGKHYKMKDQIVLSIYAFSHAAYWISVLVLALQMNTNIYLWGVIALRLISFTIIMKCAARQMKEDFSIGQLWCADVFWMIYHFILVPYIFFKSRQTWNSS